jgi:hypothetical protein
MSSLPPSPARPESTARTVDALLQDGKPCWGAIGFEVLCSRCGYNLRMLPQPRCPECGLTFDWRTALDSAAGRSEVLFEHHWQTRPLWSWRKTMWASFRPFRFWRNVSIHDRVEGGPLSFLLLTSGVWFIAAYNATVLLIRVYQRLASQPPSISFGEFEDNLALAFFILCALLLALLMLCGLRQTLGRCRVRSIQLLRVFAYASTPLSMWLAVLSAVFVCTTQTLDRGPGTGTRTLDFSVGGIALILVCPVLFLTAGLKRYLQLPRPLLLAGTAVFIGACSAAIFLGLLFSCCRSSGAR